MPTRLPYGLSFVKPNSSANSGAYTFAAGDATPDVSMGTFFIGSVSAATITNFDGGERGKVICVYCDSATGITIQNSAGGINLPFNVVTTISSSYLKYTATAGNATMADAESMWFIHNGTDWSMLGTRIAY
jgi:hypothetical protein